MPYSNFSPLQALAMPVDFTRRLKMITYIDGELKRALTAKNLMFKFWEYMDDIRLKNKVEINSAYGYTFSIDGIRADLRTLVTNAYRSSSIDVVKIPTVLEECIVLGEGTITTIDIYKALETSCNLSTLSCKAQAEMEQYLIYHYVKEDETIVNFLEGLT